MSGQTLSLPRALYLQGPVLVALAGVIGLCWHYLIQMAGAMSAMDMPLAPWTAAYATMMVTMWVIMMIGMMLPSALPMILIYLRVARFNRLPFPMLAAAMFLGGYLLIWSLFAAGATLLQWQLEQWLLLSPAMASANVVFSALLLIIAGAYQWSPWKDACLNQCRGPVTFISRHWRPGLSGAWVMGLLHGTFCTGCCWALMALLFVGGVMNLLMIGLLTLLVLLEKILPAGILVPRIMGSLLIGTGISLILVQ